MFQDKYIFAQLTVFLDRNHFNCLVRKYGGDEYVKYFTCWNQLLALMSGQLSNRESLRNYYMVEQARGKQKTDIFKLGGNVYAFDSTTIGLCLSVFCWVKFCKRRGGIKVHTLL